MTEKRGFEGLAEVLQEESRREKLTRIGDIGYDVEVLQDLLRSLSVPPPELPKQEKKMMEPGIGTRDLIRAGVEVADTLWHFAQTIYTADSRKLWIRAILRARRRNERLNAELQRTRKELAKVKWENEHLWQKRSYRG